MVALPNLTQDNKVKSIFDFYYAITKYREKKKRINILNAALIYQYYALRSKIVRNMQHDIFLACIVKVTKYNISILYSTYSVTFYRLRQQ